jgi:hypothetical protein
MTSIEWFFNELIEKKIVRKDNLSTYHDFPTTFELSFMEAKEMHKQEIIDAWNDGHYASLYSKENDKYFIEGSEYYQQTFVSNFKQFSLYEHKETITSDDTQVSQTFLEAEPQLPQQETLYTEEQAIEFAKWLAANWFPMWVKDKFVWEHDWDKTCEEQKYQGYYNEKELFNLFLSLKQPKK